ncbi:cytochrome P450 [Streptomyces sp. NPDC091281]|uniref:cytochrome P450 n=1 Tax=Streptomyces sp. NPDC091281 TaxID=3365985 RepID=UPI00381EF109
MDAQTPSPTPPPGCPAHGPGGRVPLYGPTFDADPQAYYALLRQYGPTAPVELAPGVEATLVTDHATALKVLRDTATYRKDARRWRDLMTGRIPADNPAVPLLAHRPNCMFADGGEHQRLRRAVTDSMAHVDFHRLTTVTGQATDYLIAQFSSRGSADLMADYARQLPLLVFNELFGCPAEIGDRVVFGISGMFDGVNAEESAHVLHGAVAELVALKRAYPGDDVASWMAQHRAALSDEEMTHQLSLLLGASAEPLRNLIGNTLHLLLTRRREAYEDVRQILNDTLWENPPVANFAPHYPVTDTVLAGQKLAAGDLVLIGFAAANTGLALMDAIRAGSSQGSLAWSAGPHACPSKDVAQHVTIVALEKLLARVPDIELAVPANLLTWRPGPFHRALNQLPVRFEPVQPLRSSGPPVPPATPGQGAGAAPHRKQQEGGKWSQFLAWLTG